MTHYHKISRLITLILLIIFSLTLIGCGNPSFESSESGSQEQVTTGSTLEPTEIQLTEHDIYVNALALYLNGKFYESSKLFTTIANYQDAQSLKINAHQRMLLAPVRKNGRWGYIDQYDNLVLDFQYEEARPFKDGRALVRQNAQWMLIDSMGQETCKLDTEWLEVGHYSDGLASFAQQDQDNGILYGAIDYHGNVVFAPFSHIPLFFVDHVALALYDNQVLYMTTDGSLFERDGLYNSHVMPDHPNDLYPTNIDSLSLAYRGFCTPGGLVMEADDYSNFYELYVNFYERSFDNYIGEGYLYPDGTVAIGFKYSIAGEFVNELAAVRDWNDQWGFIDRWGNYVIEPVYEIALGFSQGLAAVKYNGLYGYIDESGTMVIEPQFEDAYPFSEGLAGVKIIDKPYLAGWGFIDKTGEFVIEPQFGYVGRSGFLDGYCLAGRESDARQDEFDMTKYKYGFINQSGSWKISPRHTTQVHSISHWPGFYHAEMNYFNLDNPGLSHGQFDCHPNNHGERIVRYYFNSGTEKTRIHGHDGFVEQSTPCDISDDERMTRITSLFTDMPARGFSPQMLNEILLDRESFPNYSPHHHGFAIYSENGLLGFTDEQGEIQIPASYEMAGHFGNGNPALLPVLQPIDVVAPPVEQPDSILPSIVSPGDNAYYEHYVILEGSLDGRETVLMGSIFDQKGYSDHLSFREYFSGFDLFVGSGDVDDPDSWDIETTAFWPGDLRVIRVTPFAAYYKQQAPGQTLLASDYYKKRDIARLFESIVPVEKRLHPDQRRIDEQLYVVRCNSLSQKRPVILFLYNLDDYSQWHNAMSGKIYTDADDIILDPDIEPLRFTAFFNHLELPQVLTVDELQLLYDTYIPNEYWLSTHNSDIAE